MGEASFPLPFRRRFKKHVQSLATRDKPDQPPRIPGSPITAPPRSQAMLQAYGMFVKLPPELRQQVLKFAFSPGQIHIDLTYDHPTTFFEPVYEHTTSVKRILAIGYRHANILGVDRKKPKLWQWASCVCHGEVYPYAPKTDGCLLGHGFCNRIHSHGRDRSRCFIGIWGWLNACWMSYIEGSEILFAENRIKLSSPIFVQPLSKLPTLLNREHLNKIRSLFLGTSRFYPENFFESLVKYQECFSMIPMIFPNLVNLHLCLSESVAPKTLESHGRVLTIESIIISSCDNLATKLSDVNFEISMDWNLGSMLLLKYSEKRLASNLMEAIQVQKFWRKLDKNSDHESAGKGYFVSSY